MLQLFNIPNILLIILFFIAVFIGWILGKKNKQKPSDTSPNHSLNNDYFQGLNYLLNDETERATDSFVKILVAQPDKLESQVALGNIFRHKGEVNKAIRLHQDLIAKPSLSQSQRSTALLALAVDYMVAGLFDRAERILLEVYQSGELIKPSLEFLHQLYQKQKDWIKAISVAEKLNPYNDYSLGREVAFYYTELAENVLAKNNYELAKHYIKSAVKAEKNCVRASIIAGNLEKQQGNFDAAISCYQKIYDQDIKFLSEVLDSLKECYEQKQNLNGYATFLKQCLAASPTLSTVLAFTHVLIQKHGQKDAERFLMEQLRQRPSLKGLHKLIQLHIQAKNGKAKQDILILEDFMGSLLKDKPKYHCTSCGFTCKSIAWLCPSCDTWGNIHAIQGLEGE